MELVHRSGGSASSKERKRREGPVLYSLLLVMLFSLSVIFLWRGFSMYLENRFADAMWYVMGAAVASLSLLWLQRLRKGMPIPPPTPFKVITVTECDKCGLKSLRDFRDQDFILKEAEKCPKCKRKTFISSIYLETKK